MKEHTKGTPVSKEDWEGKFAHKTKNRGPWPGPLRFDLDSWKAARPRAGKVEMVTVNKTDKYPEKNRGLPEKPFENDHLHCPCTVCGHTYQGECEWHGCECCSSLCD